MMSRLGVLAFALVITSCAPSVPVTASGAPVAVETRPKGAKPAVVVGVTDGDTIKVVMDGRQENIRLNGIDAPEKRQPFGDAAKRALSDLVFGRKVFILPVNKDRYGRTVAEVFTLDGSRVGLSIVETGMAWHFVKYAPKDLGLAAAQLSAKEAQRGLWSGGIPPVSPWTSGIGSRISAIPPSGWVIT